LVETLGRQHAVADLEMPDLDDHAASKENADGLHEAGPPDRKIPDWPELHDHQSRYGDPQRVLHTGAKRGHEPEQVIVMTDPAARLHVSPPPSIEHIHRD